MEIVKGQILIAGASLPAGLEYPTLKFAILTEGQRELLAQVIGELTFLGVMALPGIIERAPWPAW